MYTRQAYAMSPVLLGSRGYSVSLDGVTHVGVPDNGSFHRVDETGTHAPSMSASPVLFTRGVIRRRPDALQEYRSSADLVADLRDGDKLTHHTHEDEHSL